MKNDNTKRFMIPIALVMCAFAVRLYAALVPGVIVPDGMVYISTAKMIDAGQWRHVADYSFYSLYPFLMVLFKKVFSDWELSGRMVSVFFGSLAVLPFYLLFKRLTDKKIAFVAALFFIISPRLVEYSSNVIREPVFWFFSIAALWAACEGMTRKKWIFMTCASFFVGMASLTRMEGVALIIIIFLWIWWYHRRGEGLTIKRSLSLAMVFVISFPVLFFTPLCFLKSKLGKWELGLIGSKIPHILNASNKSAEETFKKTIDESDAVSQIVSGNKYVFFLWQAIYKFFRSYHVLLIFLFLIGIIRRKVIPYNTGEVPVIIWLGVFFLVSLLYLSRTFYLSTRHGMLMSIPALLWVSIGFFELTALIERWTVKFRPAHGNARKITACLLVLICLIILPKTLSWSGYDKVEMKKAGIYLKKKGYSNEKIAVEPRLHRVPFYADADYCVIPSNIDHAVLRSFLDTNNAKLLIIDARTIGRSVADFQDNIAKMDLERIEIPEFDNYKEYSFIVFRVKKQG